MTIGQANKKLLSARKKRDKINSEIMALNEFLLKKKKEALSILEQRNKEIYRLYSKNKSVKDISRIFKLTPESVRIICRHSELQRKKEKIVEAWINRNSK